MIDVVMSTNETAWKMAGANLELLGATLGSITEIAAPVFPLSSGSIGAWAVALTLLAVSAALVVAHKAIDRLGVRRSSGEGFGRYVVFRNGIWMALSATHMAASVYWMFAVLLVVVSVMSWVLSAIGASIG